MKALHYCVLLIFLSGSIASGALIANFDFENYAVGSTGETSPLDTDSSPRIYNPNGALPTGIDSVSDITLTVTDAVSGQNKVESNNGSNRFRWRTMNAPATATFTVTIAAGYVVENFSMSMVQFANNSGTIDVTYDTGGGPVFMGPQGAIDGDDTLDAGSVYATDPVATQISGTVTFVITVDPTTNNRTSRWDDFQLNGDLVLVPEPSSAMLLMGALLGGACLRRRR